MLLIFNEKSAHWQGVVSFELYRSKIKRFSLSFWRTILRWRTFSVRFQKLFPHSIRWQHSQFVPIIHCYVKLWTKVLIKNSIFIKPLKYCKNLGKILGQYSRFGNYIPTLIRLIQMCREWFFYLFLMLLGVINRFLFFSEFKFEPRVNDDRGSTLPRIGSLLTF